MRDIQCKLLSKTITKDTIGVEKETIVERLIPITKVEDVYANEYYQANQQGFKPNLRLRISALNYNDEEELIYMNKTYSIIRTDDSMADELVLVCERKIKNVK